MAMADRAQQWRELVHSLHLPRVSAGRTPVDADTPPDWERIPVPANDWPLPSTNASAKQQALRISGSVDRTFVFGVVENRVITMWELREVVELNDNGGQHAALHVTSANSPAWLCHPS